MTSVIDWNVFFADIEASQPDAVRADAAFIHE
jgi:hypothetical protein